MKKEYYEKPEMEVIEFENEDIVNDSGEYIEEDELPGNGNK